MLGQNVAIRPKQPRQEDSEAWREVDPADSAALVDPADSVDLVAPVDSVDLEAKGKADPEAVLPGVLPAVQDSVDLPDPEILSMINPKKSETPGDCFSKDSNAPTTV
jgi:hypothetical protein